MFCVRRVGFVCCCFGFVGCLSLVVCLSCVVSCDLFVDCCLLFVFFIFFFFSVFGVCCVICLWFCLLVLVGCLVLWCSFFLVSWCLLVVGC